MGWWEECEPRYDLPRREDGLWVAHVTGIVGGHGVIHSIVGERDCSSSSGGATAELLLGTLIRHNLQVITHLQAHQTQLQLQGTLIQTQHQVHKTRFQMHQAELAALRETGRRRQAQMVETLQVIRDMRREMSDMQTELLALRGQHRRTRQPGPEARIPDHQDASGDADSHIQ
ncbi:hypothetical protein Tco_0769067 [Tanacetum coccineum]|uniref:Uncharacterized protein n=1 Tax=Tanacetum coccineum TaxID=301880 RepID=A0ABQ4ZB00_9ASTR